MKLKVFTLRFNESAGGFDDEIVQTFTEDKEILDYAPYFYHHDRIPCLTLVISYRHILADEKRVRPRSQPPGSNLDPAERGVFDALRTWRMVRAREEGVPPYIIASNRQLAKVVKLRARTRADLLKVDGLGTKKVEQYGDDILEILSEHGPDEARAEKDTPTDEGT